MILCSTPSKHYLDAHYAKKYRLGASFSGSVALVPEATVEKIRFWQKSEAAQTDNLEVVVRTSVLKQDILNSPE